ncbi:MAG: type II secretion system F family protein [Maricaulaceae bacterium]|nr:type II secretion system F family protein [Maricaulaceae bacterium]
MGGELAFVAIAVAIFVAVAGAGWVAAGAMGDGRKASQRKALAVGGGQHGLQRGKRQISALDQTAQRRRQVQETLKELEARQRESRKRSLTLRSRIEQAGLNFKPSAFWIASGAVGIVTFLGALATGQNWMIAAGVAAGVGLGLPRWLLGMACQRRLKKFTGEFANAIDIIVRGVKSGLPLNECLKVISNESPEPVRAEFVKLVEAQSMGVGLDDGLRRMLERVPLPELSFFTTVLLIQQKTGGNLAEALGNLSTVLRARKMMREKIGALSSEAKASAFIIGSLPPAVLLIVYVTTPAYMSTLFTDPRGQLMLLGGGLWMLIGILMMRGMINFKF